jgi:hypothetical protein
MKRQNVRRLLLISALLLFPVTMWYFSPYLILNAAVRHIINGSFIVFTLMFVLSAFFGRVWCAACCPTGGLQECAFLITDREPKQGGRNRVKYVVWGVWLAAVAACWIAGRGKARISFFFMTDHGISISSIYLYIVYYGIVILFLIPAVCAGKRAACHYFCWMAPFMIFGAKTGRLLRLPQLHMRADKEKCVSCGMCRKACPMSVNVPALVLTGSIRDDECIQCGACADICPQNVLHYSMSRKMAE